MSVAVAVRINEVLRDHQTDLSTDSGFPVYSITKTLSAICILRLVLCVLHFAILAPPRRGRPVRTGRPAPPEIVSL